MIRISSPGPRRSASAIRARGLRRPARIDHPHETRWKPRASPFEQASSAAALRCRPSRNADRSCRDAASRGKIWATDPRAHYGDGQSPASRSCQTPQELRLGDALEDALTERHAMRSVGDGAPDRIVQHDLSRPRLADQAGRKVPRIAQHRVVASHGPTNLTRHDLAQGDADMAEQRRRRLRPRSATAWAWHVGWLPPPLPRAADRLRGPRGAPNTAMVASPMCLSTEPRARDRSSMAGKERQRCGAFPPPRALLDSSVKLQRSANSTATCRCSASGVSAGA